MTKPFSTTVIGHDILTRLAVLEASPIREIWVNAAGDYNPATGAGTDDTPAFVAAANALGGAGVILIPRGLRCLIDTTLALPASVRIEGQTYRTFMGLDGLDRGSGDLYVNPSATITLGNGSGIHDCVVFRKGIQFGITSAQVASTFLGTAITLRDGTWDHSIRGCVIGGFNQAIASQSSSGSQQCNRTKVSDTMIDCLNGIRIYNAFDVPILDNVEGWPFITYASAPETNSAQLLRSGTFVWLHGVNDWSKVNAPFNFGCKIGFRLTDCQSVTVLCGGSDYPAQSVPDGSVGFAIDGSASEIRLIAPQAAQRDACVYVDSTSNLMACQIVSGNFWEFRVSAVSVARGNVQVTSGSVRSSVVGCAGVITGPAAGKVTVGGMEFQAIDVAFSNDNAGVKLRHHDCIFADVGQIMVNPYVAIIPSASSLLLTNEDTYFKVTGAVAITSVSDPRAYAGKVVTLEFVTTLGVIDGGNLRLKGDYVTAQYATLTLVSNGAEWVEISRSLN